MARARHAGYAPYLDYRAATEARANGDPWLYRYPGMADFRRGRASQRLCHFPYHPPALCPGDEQHKQQMLDKITKAVKERLTAEIQYWDFRAADLKQKEAAGKINATLNSQMAARRAEDLAARMQRRLAELDRERMISPAPPVVTGGALIIPRGLAGSADGWPCSLNSFGGADKKAVELAAMNAVHGD